MSQEVLTFQLGNLSNYIGTHWWNLQEASFVYEGEKNNEKAEINHDVTFREGLTLKDEITYTPRLISVDLSDAITNLKLDGVLYDVAPDGDRISWSHDVTMHKEERAHRKNEFLRDLDFLDGPSTSYDETKAEEGSQDEMDIEQPESGEADKESLVNKVYDLDDSVISWTDFLRLHLHPKTLSVVKQYYQSDGSFNIHAYGTNLYNNQSLDINSELEDKIHFFTEEADHLQGFHFLADIYDGFGGLASAVASDLSDQFSKKGCISFCPFQNIRQSQDNAQSLHDLINTVLTVVKLAKAGFTVVPLSLVENPWKSSHPQHTQIPGINYKSNLSYHTSAVMAAALDTATMSHRMIDGSLPLSHLTDSLSSSGRMISNLSFALPVALSHNMMVTDNFTKSINAFTSLTPLYDVKNSSGTNIQSVILRGAKSTESSWLEESIYRWSPCPASSIMQVRRPCSVKAPFPHIFGTGIDEFGRECKESRLKNQAVKTVAAMTSLSTTGHSRPMLAHLLERSAKLTRRHLHKHLDAGLELDDWTETLDDFKELVKRYEEEDNEMDTDSDNA